MHYYNNNNSSSDRDAAYKESTKLDNSKYFDSNTLASTDPKTLHKLAQARENPSSKLWVTVHGKVIKQLRDDLSGSRHQKFLIKIDKNFTLLVSHNIDLAPRVPLSKGNTVSVSGLYEWNNRGGVIHWTHHDPKGKKKGGWIKVDGKRYD